MSSPVAWMPARCSAGRSRSKSAGCTGPAFVQTTAGRWPKMPSRLIVLGRTSRCESRCSRRYASAVPAGGSSRPIATLTGSDRHRAALVGADEVLDLGGDDPRLAAGGQLAELRRGEPGVEHGAVGGDGRESVGPRRRVRARWWRCRRACLQRTDGRARSVTRRSSRDGARGCRRPRLGAWLIPHRHGPRSTSRPTPWRSRRRSATSGACRATSASSPISWSRRSPTPPHLELIRDGDCVVARTNLGRERRVVIAGHIDTVPVNDNLPTRFETVDGRR